MAKLIDADKLREHWLTNGENENIYDTNAFLDSIDEQPTVDAVEVVRCEKCVYWQETWDGSANPFGRCRRNDMTMAGSGFCSYGERREGE